MKKFLFYSFLICSLLLNAQNKQICGFDRIVQKQDRAYPGLRQACEEIIQKNNTSTDSSSMSFGKKVNNVYEIPIVVHVIYPDGAEIGSTYNKSDEDIQAWLERANQMFAGTYAWPPASVRSDFGSSTVLPIRLVLAKRDPNCNPTNGIIRYNGSTLPGYNMYGMSFETANGSSEYDIKRLAPKWPDEAYFNIYIISMFDGDPAPFSGLMGYASLPSDPSYDSFMKSGAISEPDGIVFVHEFGHSMGLLHTFNGAVYNAPSGSAYYCPANLNGNCTRDDDKVCDTERSGSNFNDLIIPSNSDINPCTGRNYEGVQYNIMNYGRRIARKFTPGQRERIVDGEFMIFRSELTTSLGGTPIPPNPSPSIVPIAASCNPAQLINYGFYVAGPISVKLGQINNSSPGTRYDTEPFYIDYTTTSCFNSAYTPLQINQAQTIEVGFYLNPHSVRVWIDYNNNGIFDASELVASGDDIAIGANKFGSFTASFTPPDTAVLNTPLRMRVLADLSDSNMPSPLTPCGDLWYGQIEDYAVKLVNTTLGTSEVKAENNDLMIYPNPVVSGDYIFIKAKDGKNLKVSISDMSGRLITSPSVTEERNGIYKVKQNLEKGVYMIRISNGKESKSSKLIIK